MCLAWNSNLTKSVVFLKNFCYNLIMKAVEILKIKQDLCLKCGGCISVYPKTFEFDENGEVRIKENSEIEASDIPDMKSVCPVGAIVEK
jgi:ferredoxin